MTRRRCAPLSTASSATSSCSGSGSRPSTWRSTSRSSPGASRSTSTSAASAYETPPSRYLIDGATPLANPLWQYSRDTIASEQLLLAAHREQGFPVTVVRPSHTYGPSQVPVAVGSWQMPFTILERMRRGAPVIVPGDGTSLWVLTLNTDFAAGFMPLLGNADAVGKALHITSEEVLTWNAIYDAVAAALGVELDVVHVPTDALPAAHPEELGSLWSDKAHSVVFDLTDLRALVPDFSARTPFAQGIQESVACFDADPSRQTVDDAANAHWDRIARIYRQALADVRR